MAASIYLDTQHISRAASGRNRLERFFVDPSFVFYFSTTHLIECLPKDATANPGAIKRLEIIMGPRTRGLVPWGKAAQIEALNTANDLEKFVCEKDHMLISEFSVSRADYNKRVRQSLKALLEEKIPDRNLRRSFQAKLLKYGKLTPAAFRFIRGEQDKSIERLSSEMPDSIPLMGPGGLYDFLEGKTSEEDFAAKFREALINPVALARMSTMPEMTSIIDLSKYFWEQTEQLSDKLSKLVESVTRAQLNNSLFDYKKFRRSFEKQIISDEYRLLIIRFFTDVKVTNEQLQVMPGTRLFADVFWQYVLEKLDQHANIESKNFASNFKFKRSDLADLTHLFYCPYVSVFGCDSSMRDRIRRAGWPIEKIVTSDSELESLLAAIQEK
jgi:hypothetical protein